MSELYAAPRLVNSLDQCQFYHTMDLPGHGTIKGNWDLRGNIDAYLGGVDFRNKRVLDVGSASGYLTFTMEGKGADVVSYDLPDHLPWDFVPFAGADIHQFWLDNAHLHQQLKNSYWFCHRQLNSRAKKVYGSVYEIPETIGPVDVAVFGSILLHLRDPFLALQKGLQITRDTVIITDGLPRRWFWQRWFGGWCAPKMLFLPRLSGRQHHGTWWALNAKAAQRMLEILGFEETRVSYHSQYYEGSKKLFFTVVGKRTRPAPTCCRLEQPPKSIAA